LFIDAKDDGGSGDNWSYKSYKAPVKSSPPTNQHPVFYRPDALPVTNQQCQSTEGKISHSILWTCLPQAHLGLLTLPLTTNSSWLPWGTVAMPLISPLLPVPQVSISFDPPPKNIYVYSFIQNCSWVTLQA